MKVIRRLTKNLRFIATAILIAGIIPFSACIAPDTSPGGKVVTYTITVTIEPAGAGTVSPESGEYNQGEKVGLTATPAAGYRFDYWSGDVILNYASILLHMDSNKTVTAHFKTDDDTIPDPGSYNPGNP